MAFPVFPPISIRLTRCQYDLIGPGFRRIASLHAYCVANGVKPIFYLLAFSPRPNTTKGRYDQALMAALLELRERLASLFTTPGGSRRLRLTALQIEFLMFAARVTCKQVEHCHIERPKSYSAAKIKRLLGWLESRRKRAKRCWQLSSTLREAYPQMQLRWAKLLPWIHWSLLYCACHRQPATGVRRQHRMYVDHVVKLAHEVLDRRNIPTPERHELRKLCRAFLRSMRLGYQRTTLGQVLRGGSWTKEILALFLVPRVQKLRSPKASRGVANAGLARPNEVGRQPSSNS